MKRTKTFERRIKKLLKDENGKRIHDGAWWFPFEDAAYKLVKIAEDFGLSRTKQVKFRGRNIPEIMLFTEMKPRIAPIELKQMEAKIEKQVKEAVQRHMEMGKEHQRNT